MLTFHFDIKPRLLAYTLIKNTSESRFVSGECDPEIVKFQNAGYIKDKASYDFIRFGLWEDFYVSNKSISDMAKNCDLFLEEMIIDSTFAPLLAQTNESLLLVREEWESNSVKTCDIIAQLTGLKIDADIPVYLTHPKINQGSAGREFILWAYRLTWPNYNTVYLWHEYLHIAIPGGELEHAVIQLVADNELRVFLNGGSYPPIEGHEYLRKLMSLLLPEWQRYLHHNKQKNVRDFIAKMAVDADVIRELQAIKLSRNVSLK